LNQMILRHATIERLKVTQTKYVEQFLEANVNETYIRTRIKIGEVHSRINLTANHFIMAHDMLVQFMTTILMEQLSKDTEKMLRLVVAIQKLASFDKQLIVDEYTESTLKKFLYEISGLLNNVTEIDTTHQLFERMNQQIEETHSVTAATEEMSASIQDVS